MNPDVIDVVAKPAEPATGGKTQREMESLRHLTMVGYLLNAAGFLFGITWFIAIVLNYIKRDAADGTLYASHFAWQIRTFWWGLLWACLGTLTLLLGVGFAVLVVAYLWVIYRVVKGFIYWSDEKPMKI
ncbi:MAG: DUF4870 family protein [Burkholderiales bacterium]